MIDDIEAFRRARVAELNQAAGERLALEEKHGQVWNTDELCAAFSVQCFTAPYVLVTRKADGVAGSLEFQHTPRYYFNWSVA